VVTEEQDSWSTGCCSILVFCFATNSFGTSYEQTVSCINNTLTQLYHKFNKYTKGSWSTGCCSILVFCFATNSFGTSYEQTVSCINNTLTQLYHKFNKYTKGTA